MGKKIVWTRIALDQLYEIHECILNTTKSLSIADKVVIQIQKSTLILSTNHEIYPLDTFRRYNDGSYRAYETFHYRIAYKFSGDIIRISSVRHTSRFPKSY